MFSYEFMQHAFLASTLIAIISGIVGVFVIARSMSFLTHTLSEIGFAGAAFGVFAGWSALNGMLVFTIVSSMIVGQMSVKPARRESAITAVSALFIGLGILFLALSNQNSTSATSILFGSVIGIDSQEVLQMALLCLIVLIVVFFSYRQLKFDSFDEVGARVNGVNSTLISIIFLVLLALSVSVAAQIVGALLIFILLTLPAASAKYFVHSVFQMMLLAIGFALVGTWLGLYLGYVTNWPVSFFIAFIEVAIYCGSLIKARLTNN
ncbi:metal ABC transporter permease [Paucilactobacillus sp. N302-9]